MKKAVMLPLVAAISGAMVGCGGGGGGGGSTTPSPKSYTFQFIQMEVNKDPATISCASPTIFKSYSDGNVDYAKIASGNIDIHTYNADGSFNKDLSSKLGSDGRLTFTVNDVQDGGYVTVIDNLGSSSSPVLHSLSIQKELLSDLLINVESLQGNQASCYTSNKLNSSGDLKKASLGSSDGGLTIDAYSYETYIDGYESSTANIKTEMPVTSNNEQVMFTGLHAGKVVAAKMVTAGTLTADSASSPGSVALDTLTSSIDLNWAISGTQVLGSSFALAFSDNVMFKWQEISQSTLDLLVLDDLGYSFLLEGQEAGWSILSNTPVNANQVVTEVALTNATISTGITPQINSCASGCVVDTQNAVDSNDNGFQRSYFEVSAKSKHTIYAKVPNNSETVIPNYNINDAYKPTDGLTPEVSFFLSKDDLTESFTKFAMNKYNNPGSTSSFVDKVSVVALPSESLIDKQKNASLQYEVIER
ncbi:hypothetical protein L1D34_14015 [Vibrio mediterranei]|uniref:hypothetical protein n=1 Tax=Vibrio mediterranei TaxID=689 RepID=UPI001EFD351A|nr:hypothetical protein [Vibrio mediterranei]MCG9625952.1 hypothetical protein [Vibrio mediterranei]